MFEKIKDLFNMEEPIYKLVKLGFKISSGICILAAFMLIVYNQFYISRDLYDGSFILFRTGLLFAIQFLICGIAINKIKNEN